MSKIKAKDLLKLGFKREDNIPTTAMDNEYHYYIYEIGKKGILISNSNDEKINGGYEVELYDIPEIKFTDLKQLKKLVKALKQRT
jgi:hypothetical protein